MTRVRWIVAPAVTLVVLGLGAASLFAQPGGLKATQFQKDTIRFMGEHKMTLAKAIEAAERETKGQALSATALMEGNDVIVNVSCLVDENVKHVSVDVKTGKVAETATTPKAPTVSQGHNTPRLPKPNP